MNASHICLSCRRRLGQLLHAPRIVQWRAKANFISLSTPPPTQKPQSQSQTQPTPSSAHEKSESHTTSSDDDLTNLGHHFLPPKSRHAAIPPQKKRPAPRPGSSNPGDVLESLFEETRKAPSHKTVQSFLAISSLEPYKNAETLKEMLQHSGQVEESWKFFVEHFQPHSLKGTAHEHGATPSFLHSLAQQVRRQLMVAKANDPLSQTLPTFTEISKVYVQLGLLQGSHWVEMVNMLLENILKKTDQAELDKSNNENLLLDLLGAWNVVCRPLQALLLQRSHGSALDWSHLPNISQRDAEATYRKGGLETAFGLLTPSFPTRQIRKLPSIAFATFNLITDESLVVPSAGSALSRVLAPLLSISSLDPSHIQASVVGTYVKENFTKIREKASTISLTLGEEAKRRYEPHFADQRVETGMSFINKRIHAAINRRDLGQLDHLWADVETWPIGNTEPEAHAIPGSRVGTLSLQICNLFIMGFTAVRQGGRSVNVWNHMVKNGITPTLQTWNSMLIGCSKSGNWKGLQDVWMKMKILKVQPDAIMWTTFIHGLIDCRQFNLAIQALDEMGRVWLAAAKLQNPTKRLPELLELTDIEGVIKPEIGLINAAIGAFIRFDKIEPAKQILAWANRYSIFPDVITYNTLLRHLIRSGNSTEAMALLQQMAKAGVQADVVTFTTILDEAFRYAEFDTPEEQKKLVEFVFEEMQAAGVSPNHHTYGKIISSLLMNCQGDLTTVNAVLEGMNKQGLQPTAHIFTNLTSWYFEQTPPDLDAIRSLIERASAVTGSTDHIFWDRVIEGYARIGDTAAAVRTLGKLSKTKIRFGWPTLKTLVVALADNQEWDLAKTVVRDLITDRGPPPEGNERGTEGEHDFWHTVRDLQLLAGH